MEKGEDKDQEKRAYNRIKYNPNKRPKLQIETNIFEVVEISEKELWLTSDNKIDLDKNIEGKLTFLNGESVGIEGIVLWEEDILLGVQLENLIPSEMIIREQRYLISHSV